MIKNLVIVESPTKAKTIQNYLGKEFKVTPSFGHICDLPKKEMGIDIKNNFKPIYIVSPDKKNIVKKLKSIVNKSDIIWLASDEDREGEAIAWHIYKELKIPKNKVRRIIFNEITKKSITYAIKNPRSINKNLVNAQQARRILDRLVGFKLSPVLWKKIKTGLSAGRVQSIAVRLIVEREKDIKSFKIENFYKLYALFISEKGEKFKAELKDTFKSKEQSEIFINKCINTEFKIYKIKIKSGKKNPSTPFTTSTLQQETSRKLGYSIKKTMYLAQKLYEKGYITYMRTDSLNLSQEIIFSIKNYITKQFGKNYVFVRKYINKNKFIQEAHEAIRPTNIEKIQVNEESSEQRLYDIIWKRTIASQMSEAIFEKKIVYINAPDQNNFIAKGETIIFDGFLKIYKENKIINKEEFKEQLPKLKEKELLKNKTISAIQCFTKYPPRYGEASLVKTLEELGIGRPSTYAPIISVIQKRNYVEFLNLKKDKCFYEILTLKKGKILKKIKKRTVNIEKKKLVPTNIGIVVNNFLVKNFQQILDYSFTAKVEENFDKIAQGKEIWNKLIKKFYKNFHLKVEEVIKRNDKTHGERLLGIDPKTGKKVFSRIGKFGPIIQIGEIEDLEKPKFASLLKNQYIDSISLEEALKLFEFPKELGFFEEKKITINIGKYGPYIKHDKKFISIKEENGYSPNKITLKESIKIIEQNRKKNSKNLIQCFKEFNPPIEVINGRFGPYIRQGKSNYRISKNIKLEDINIEICKKIISYNNIQKEKKLKND